MGEHQICGNGATLALKQLLLL